MKEIIDKKSDEKKKLKSDKNNENKTVKAENEKTNHDKKKSTKNKKEIREGEKSEEKKRKKITNSEHNKEINENEKKQKNKEKLIKNEIKRLDSNLKQIPQKKKLVAKGLIEEAAYMKATMRELKEEIDKKGPIDNMQQGNYSIIREHPALKAYNTTIQRYSTVIKLLTDLIPKEIQKEESDGFDEFVGERDD